MRTVIQNKREAEKLRLTKLLINEQGFDQINSGRWNDNERKLFFHAAKLFIKDWRVFSFVMGSRDLRPIRSTVQKMVKKYKLQNSKNPEEAERAYLVMRLGSKNKTDDGAGVTIKCKWYKDFSNFLLA